MNKTKIFIGLREISGYFSGLKEGFEEIGIDAVFLNLGGNKFNYSEGKNPFWISILNSVGNRVGSIFSKNFVLRFIWLTIFQNIFSLIAFFIAVCKYDVFILGSNSTFFYFLELPILKLFRKKIIYVFLGSDSRPLYLNGYVFKSNPNPRLYILLTSIQKRVIKIIEKYSTIIVNHPPQAYFHEKSFASLLLIGIPYNGKRIPVDLKGFKKNDKRIKIIHIPSKSGPKGSNNFRLIIQRLKEKYPIDYFEISGISHEEVIGIISSADIALDEFYSDTPMSVFATECAFQSVPVVVGSYYSESIQSDYLRSKLPPSIFVSPEDIGVALEKLITNENYRKKVGKDAYEFVTLNWSAKVVAEKYLALISGVFPNEWYYDPYTISYLYGCGLSHEQLKENVEIFIKKRGIKSLCLNDKPNLEKEYLNIANKKKDNTK